MKKKTKKKVKKTKVETKLKDELWQLCKQIIRLKYGNVCYTCGKEDLKGSNWHTGHFIPKAFGGEYLKYDLRNLRPQCYNCNINLGGNGAIFYHLMLKEESKTYVNSIFKGLTKEEQHTKDVLEKKIKDYKTILNKLKKEC